MLIRYNDIRQSTYKIRSDQKPLEAEANDVPMPGAAGADGEDDAAQWRRTQSRRKARGKRFLEDPFSSFHLLTSLALSAILAPVTNLCFKFVNSDKKGIALQPEVRAQKRLKRQMKAKGPAIFAEESSQELHFYNVKLKAEKCAGRLWAEMEELHLLTCASIFWPEGNDSLKFNFLADNLLECLAGVRWRILDKFQLPPWSLAGVAIPGCSDESVPWQGIFFCWNFRVVDRWSWAPLFHLCLAWQF